MSRTKHTTKSRTAKPVRARRKVPETVYEFASLLRELHERVGAKGMRRAAGEIERSGEDPLLVTIFRQLARISPNKQHWDEMLGAALTFDHRGAQS